MVVGSVVLHAFFAYNQAFTNDEGAYLYDAKTLLQYELPAGDVLTKAPVPILFFALGEVFTGRSLFASRIVNSFFSISSVVPLFFLLRRLGGEQAARIGSTAWLLGSGTIVFHSMGHTQTIASFFALWSLLFFVTGMQAKKILLQYIFFSALCFALAYASRKTAIAVSIPMIIFLGMFRDSMHGLAKSFVVFLFGLVSVCVLWASVIYNIYGLQGVWHMFGGAYGNMLVHSNSVMPWAGRAQHMFAESVRIGSLYGIFLLISCVAIKRNNVVVGASWVATLGVLYAIWPTHLVEYLADFIPAIVIAGALAIASLSLARMQQYVLGIFLVFLSTASLFSVYSQPWTGMFTRDAIMQSAQWLTEHVPMQEKIFTAAVIVPYVSGHDVLFHLSHPQWYAYEFISEQDKYTFLPSYDAVYRAVRDEISWTLHDQLTRYSYPDIDTSAFAQLYSVQNATKFRNNPLRVYFRN